MEITSGLSLYLSTMQAFYPGACAGPTFPGFAYAAESGSRAVSLTLDTPSMSARSLDHMYYNGGGHFLLPTPLRDTVKVLARYTDTRSDLDHPVAAVLCSHGRGKALLCSVHFEYPLNDSPAQDAIAKLSPPPGGADIEQAERARIDWAAELLELLGLKPPGRRRLEQDIVNSATGEDPAVLLHPTHPSPIFVLSDPLSPSLVASCFSAVSLMSKMTEEGGLRVLRDGNDELRIASASALSLEASKSDAMTRYLAERRRSKPVVTPSIDQLSLGQPSDPLSHQHMDLNSIPKPIDLNSIAKLVITPTPSLPYLAGWTPLFNFDTYWTELDDTRKRYGRHSESTRTEASKAETSALGDLLWYAETVTSTQTMLDRYVTSQTA